MQRLERKSSEIQTRTGNQQFLRIRLQQETLQSAWKAASVWEKILPGFFEGRFYRACQAKLYRRCNQQAQYGSSQKKTQSPMGKEVCKRKKNKSIFRARNGQKRSDRQIWACSDMKNSTFLELILKTFSRKFVLNWLIKSTILEVTIKAIEPDESYYK